MADATGSVNTAASSLRPSGTSMQLLRWATSCVDHPPPVPAQYPTCKPAGRLAEPSPSPLRRSQWLAWPAAHGGHGGVIPRATHDRTGLSTTHTVVAEPDHLVSGDEGEADDVLEPP